MPLYEYKCEKCGELFEVRQKFADEPLRIHEKCGGLANRLLSVPALQFKGSGWYVNDYGKGSKGSGDTGVKTESSDKKDSADKKDSGDKKATTDKKDSGTPSTATTGVSSPSSSETKSS